MDPATNDENRRTWLAGERTFLAWSRNGLAALAVAIAMGRIVPDLTTHTVNWPYLAAGAGYGLLGIAFLLYGMFRHIELDEVLARGGFRRLPGWVTVGFSFYGVGLGLFTTVVVLLSP
jgi:uncharacterized membrane protein YidH (DUF202 family)